MWSEALMIIGIIRFSNFSFPKKIRKLDQRNSLFIPKFISKHKAYPEFQGDLSKIKDKRVLKFDK